MLQSMTNYNFTVLNIIQVTYGKELFDVYGLGFLVAEHLEQPVLHI